jgi:hypothetical protein
MSMRYVSFILDHDSFLYHETVTVIRAIPKFAMAPAYRETWHSSSEGEH